MQTNRKETAAFIRSLTSELAEMAREANFKPLGYILDIAKHEATHAEETAAVLAPPRRTSRKPKRMRSTNRAA